MVNTSGLGCTFALGLALFSAQLFGCSEETEPRTELLLVADTDIPNVNEIVFNIAYRDERRETRTSTFTRAEELPRSLALVRDEGPLGPLTVSARLMSGGRTVSRSHEVSFVPGQTLVVPLHLARACTNMQCPEQCSEDGCVPTRLDTLEPYTGDVVRAFETLAKTDAGSPSELRDCGGEQVDLQTSLDHCGRCDNPCSAGGPNAGRNVAGQACEAGVCVLVCKEGFGDCNNRRNDGCEQALSESNEHCGACDLRCGNGSSCVASECTNRGP